jgi:hypothetical protein
MRAKVPSYFILRLSFPDLVNSAETVAAAVGGTGPPRDGALIVLEGLKGRVFVPNRKSGGCPVESAARVFPV